MNITKKPNEDQNKMNIIIKDERIQYGTIVIVKVIANDHNCSFVSFNLIDFNPGKDNFDFSLYTSFDGLLISLYLKFKSMRLKEKRVDIMFILCILELVLFITIHIILLYIFLKIRYNSVMKMFKRIKIILYINIDTQCR